MWSISLPTVGSRPPGWTSASIASGWRSNQARHLSRSSRRVTQQLVIRDRQRHSDQALRIAVENGDTPRVHVTIGGAAESPFSIVYKASCSHPACHPTSKPTRCRARCARRGSAGATADRPDRDQPDEGWIRLSRYRCLRYCTRQHARFTIQRPLVPQPRAKRSPPTTRVAVTWSPPESIVLTSSTSDAYSLLFKLLCEPSGDEVLTPAPSYPLFEHLTRLDGVSPVPYRLEYHGRWMLDHASVASAWGPRTRAVLAVSPNNPTGSCLATERTGSLIHVRVSRRGAHSRRGVCRLSAQCSRRVALSPSP